MRYSTCILLVPLFLLISGCDFKSAASYREEAEILLSKGDYRNAIVLFEKAIIKNPANEDAYMEYARCYNEMQLCDSAILVYKRLLQVDTANEQLHDCNGK